MEKTYGKAARLKAFRDRFAFPSRTACKPINELCIHPH